MKVLVLGATGMLGHKLARVLADEDFEVVGTVRAGAQHWHAHPALAEIPLVEAVQAENFDSVLGVMASARPLAVINCIGIVKSHESAEDPLPMITVNALFPHRLARACQAAGCRLIHVSTDCVFSGRKGNYTEDDTPDPVDLYGRAKLMGEVAGPGALTLRTSMIGREIAGPHGLLEWFLGRRGGRAPGWRRAIFSGPTTLELARAVARLLREQPGLEGLWHLAADPISKLELLGLIDKAYGLGTRIEPDDSVAVDRSLDAGRLRQATAIVPPPWPEMIEQMRRDENS